MLEFLGMDNFKSDGDDVFDLFVIRADSEAEAYNKLRILTGLVDVRFDDYCEKHFSFELIPVASNKDVELGAVSLGRIRSVR